MAYRVFLLVISGNLLHLLEHSDNVDCGILLDILQLLDVAEVEAHLRDCALVLALLDHSSDSKAISVVIGDVAELLLGEGDASWARDVVYIALVQHVVELITLIVEEQWP